MQGEVLMRFKILSHVEVLKRGDAMSPPDRRMSTYGETQQQAEGQISRWHFAPYVKRLLGLTKSGTPMIATHWAATRLCVSSTEVCE